MVNIGFASAYHAALNDVYNYYQYESSPRGQKIREIINYSLNLTDVRYNAFYNSEKDSLTYLKKELALYFNGSRSVDDFAEASTFWKKLSTDRETINSAYGYLLFVKKNTCDNNCTQWEWCVNTLAKDPDSRQAIMYLGGSDFQTIGVKDFVCTSTYHFFIRKNQIHLIVNRRSQDIIFGMTYDVPWELLLMQCMKEELNNRFNENFTLGDYHLHCGSLHIYERHFPLAEKMLKAGFINCILPKIEWPTPILNTPAYNKWLKGME